MFFFVENVKMLFFCTQDLPTKTGESNDVTLLIVLLGFGSKQDSGNKHLFEFLLNHSKI